MTKQLYEDAVAYLCAPVKRGKKTIDGCLSEQWQDCWIFGSNNGLRCSFIQEYDLDAGADIKDRRGLVWLLEGGLAERNIKKIVIYTPECLSASPSEFLAILKVLKKRGIEVIFVKEPEVEVKTTEIHYGFSTKRALRSEL